MNLPTRLKSLSLRWKLILPTAAMLVLSTLVISGYLISRQVERFRTELNTKGETIVRLLATNAESGVLFGSNYELDQVLLQVSAFDDVVYANITNTSGSILAQTGEWNEENIAQKTKIAIDFHEETGDDYLILLDDQTEYYEISHPVVTRHERLDREILGRIGASHSYIGGGFITERIGTITLILSLQDVNQSIRAALTGAFLLTALVLIASFIMLGVIARFITKPINRLVEVTDQVRRGDFSETVDIAQSDELGHLADTFNSMIASLKQSREEIEEYNRTLEQKIIERTLALEEAQAQLVQSEKMSAIGQLAAGVAHELNNPLGGILGYAQFALEKMRKSIAEKGTNKDTQAYIRYISDVETQARRCKTIVQNLLRFSRSSKTLDFAELDINKIVSETCTFIEHQMKMNQISLEMDLQKDIPLFLGNAGQLQQVFTNLLINAMHASAEGSSIQLITRFMPAVGEFSGAIEIDVVDQGTGITPENLKKVFEPFFTTKAVGQGTGLGLSVSYGIIRDHGGEIRIESTVGQGTMFSVILPVQKATVSTDILTNN